MATKFKHYGPAILWAFFIFIICSIPMGKVSESHLFFPGFDKLVHCGLFAVLAILYCDGSIRRWHSYQIRFAVAAKNTFVLISYGAFIEMAQKYWFTWRTGSWDDLFADCVGACIGVFGAIVIANAISYEKV